MKAMRKLNLQGAQVTDASMDIFAGMDRLQVVNLYRTKITNAGLARLQGLKELDGCRPALQPRDFERRRIAARSAAEFQDPVRRILRRYSRKSAAAAQPAAGTDKAIAAWVKAMGGSADFAVTA